MLRALAGLPTALLVVANPAWAQADAAAPPIEPVGAAAAPAEPTPVPAPSRGAFATLFEQAQFWRLQNRPDRALAALDRILAVDPRHPEALAGAARAQVQLGNAAAAEALVARLRDVAPNDRRVEAAEGAVRGATVDRGEIEEARRLARGGSTAEAVRRYRTLFGAGEVPEAYALEYALALAGTEAGIGEGRERLRRLAAQNPADMRLQTAYAQVLTYREATRADGIERLARLAAQPSAEPQVRDAWRQALAWRGADPAVVPQLEAYLRRHPDDPGIARQLAEAKAATGTPASPNAEARQRGFEQLEAGRLRDATQRFEAALAVAPNDADATGGLGLARLREGRAAEALTLLQRAAELDPARRGQWQGAIEGAGYSVDLTAGRDALRRGGLDAAETALRRAAGRDVADRADAETLLGDLALRRGDAAAAEARYRAALSHRPRLEAALRGLATALTRQGRAGEAQEVVRRLPSVPAGAGDGGAGRAAALREEAGRAPDRGRAETLLREAMAADPRSPWARLDLARLMLRDGRSGEARALMEAARAADPEHVFAQALFAEADQRPADAVQLAERVPARLRPAELGRLLARARGAGEAEAAAALGLPAARAPLLAIAGRPDSSGLGAAAAIRALGVLGDRTAAAEAARLAQAANRQPTPGARLTIAAALSATGLDQEAEAVAATVERDPAATQDDRRQALAVRGLLVVRAADRLNEQGEQAAAFDRLAPLLAREPQDPAANLALGRLYAGARQPEEARRIAEAVLARDPRNLDARTAAAEAAVAVGDRARAEQLLAEAELQAPSDSRVALLEARVARAAGDPRRALRALERAAELRAAGASRPGGGGTGSLGLAVAAPVTGAGANPFRLASAALPAGAGPALGAARPGFGPRVADPVLTDIAQEYAALREEIAPRLLGSPGVRVRSGDAGLDRLTELSAPVEASLGGLPLGGRLAARATAVSLVSDDLARDRGSLRRFGGNVGGTPAFAPRETDATGVALGLSYTMRNAVVDVGSSPLGFPVTNIVGGIELAPALGGGFRLRLTGERRPVTDSLLSWAGSRDPVTGQRWGGVARTGGRAQLEYASGPFSAYANAGYAAFEAENTRSNTRIEGGAGLSYAVLREPNSEVRAGADLVYFAYDNNQRLFTLGQGGYFSPQSFLAFNLPVDWRARSGDLSWRLGGTVGVASFREDGSPLYPTDAGLQAAAVALAATDPSASAFSRAQSRTTFTGGVRGDVEYALTPALRIGAGLQYDRSADFNEARGFAYARYTLPP